MTTVIGFSKTYPMYCSIAARQRFFSYYGFLCKALRRVGVNSMKAAIRHSMPLEYITLLPVMYPIPIASRSAALQSTL